MEQPETKTETRDKSRGVYLKLGGIQILLNGPLSIILLVILVAIIAWIFYLVITRTGPGEWASGGLWLAFIIYWSSAAECCRNEQLRIAHVAPNSSAPDVWRAFDSAAARAWPEAPMVARITLDPCADRFGDTGKFGFAGNLGAETPGTKLEWGHHEES